MAIVAFFATTTTKLISRDSVQTLTQTVIKFNRLIKYLRIFESGRFIYRVDRLTKCIYGGGHFIYKGGQDCQSRKIDLR
jgi:hypothetical protein